MPSARDATRQAGGHRPVDADRPVGHAAPRRESRRRTRGGLWGLAGAAVIALVLLSLVGVRLQRRAAEARCLVELTRLGVTVRSREMGPAWWMRLSVWLDLRGSETVEALFFPTDHATDEHVRVATTLRGVRHLYLDGAAVTDRSLEYVRAFRNLTTLWLGGTSVSHDAVEALKRDRPGVTIYGP